MKKFILLLSLITSNLYATTDSSSRGIGKVRVNKSLSAETSAVYFGNITTTNESGIVTLSPETSELTSDNTRWTMTQGKLGSITIYGEPDVPIELSYPTENISLINTSSKEQETLIYNVLTDKDSTQIGTDGVAIFHFGGTLNIPTNSVKGNYKGHFPISIKY